MQEADSLRKKLEVANSGLAKRDAAAATAESSKIELMSRLRADHKEEMDGLLERVRVFTTITHMVVPATTMPTCAALGALMRCQYGHCGLF